MKGKLIVLEGIDGSGKTTQARRLKDKLTLRGVRAVIFREPGTTPFGEQMRDLLLNHVVSCRAEVLAFMASRAELFHKMIPDALENGCWVIMDRGPESTYAYQHDLSLTEWQMLTAYACQGMQADLTLYLKIDPETAASRLSGTKKDRFEIRDQTETIRRYGHLGLVTLDGSRMVEAVESLIWDKVRKL